MIGFIYSNQGSLFGHSDVVGFGKDDFYVKLIERDVANEIIRKNHYSGKFYNLSLFHFGLFLGGKLLGILQFGHLMNPASYASVVSETNEGEALELNRMWVSDLCPRNTEFQAISYCIKVLVKANRSLKWIQSFADERCGLYGVVYQAANFDYYGEHKSIFWDYCGEVYHNVAMTTNPPRNQKEADLQKNKENATRYELRQFRYIFFCKKSFRNQCQIGRQPYPKKAVQNV